MTSVARSRRGGSGKTAKWGITGALGGYFSFAPLAKLTGLKALRLICDKITPAVFIHFANLKELLRFEVLGPDKWEIADEHLAHLKGLVKLEQLEINKGTVSDAGLVTAPAGSPRRGSQLSGTYPTVARAPRAATRLPSQQSL